MSAQFSSSSSSSSSSLSPPSLSALTSSFLPPQDVAAQEVLTHLCETLAEEKGFDIQLFKQGEDREWLCQIVCFARSKRHAQSLCRTVEKHVKGHGLGMRFCEGEELGEWIAMDLGDWILHIFDVESYPHSHRDDLFVNRRAKRGS